LQPQATYGDEGDGDDQPEDPQRDEREVVTVNERAPFTELVRLMAVHGVMTAPVITIGPEASVPVAARLLARHGIKRLPVVEENRLVGIVSRADLLRLFLRDDETIHREIVDEVLLRALWIDPGTVLVTVRDGVVTLVGHLERKSLVQMAVHLTRTVPGVVDVVGRLSFELDDDRLPLPPVPLLP
jgi:CBS-domain-containing membrane protein